MPNTGRTINSNTESEREVSQANHHEEHAEGSNATLERALKQIEALNKELMDLKRKQEKGKEKENEEVNSSMIRTFPEGYVTKEFLEEMYQKQFKAQIQDKLLAEGMQPPSTQPFTKAIMEYQMPAKMKPPAIQQYNGITDPAEHLQNFQDYMSFVGASDEAMCRSFPITLKGVARNWYSSLIPGSIGSFAELAAQFLSHFVGSKKPKKTSIHLMTIRQEPNETLRSFLTRFLGMAIEIEDLAPSSAVTALIQATTDVSFQHSLSKNPPSTMAELRIRGEKYINAEEILLISKPVNDKLKGDTERSEGRTGDNRNYSRGREERNQRRPRREDRRMLGRFDAYTPLNESPARILMQIRDEAYVRWPEAIRCPEHKLDRSKYCRFHKGYGHDTDECIQLKDEIEFLIRRGRLRRFAKEGELNNRHERRPREQERQQERQQERGQERRPERAQARRVINVISGGLASGGESSSKRKAYARSVYNMEAEEKKARLNMPITFSDEDLVGIKSPHDDAMVISLMVEDCLVKKVLVDTGSAADVLFYKTFQLMEIPEKRLRPVKTSLCGFTGDSIIPEGAITLPVLLGEGQSQKEIMVDFLVVKVPSAYNAILGRPSMGSAKAIISMHHLMLKFPTSNGVGEIKGDQQAARECYLASTKSINMEVQALTEPEEEVKEDEQKLQPEGPVRDFIVDPEQSRKLKVGMNVTEFVKESIERTLNENIRTFAYDVMEMPGIPAEVIKHHLNVWPSYKPVKQKKRNFAPERQQSIKEEVEKLEKAGFIREVMYPEWLANVVLVKKSNGKWRMCVDFTDLNKACPKDSYPLPKIDQLVDSTAGHELLSFLDAYSGYHQISLAAEDKEKTSFITPQGTYCYNVMPFGLKNAGATFQRLVDKIFVNQIGRNVEAYVDDIVVKSKKAESHAADLEEVFSALNKYGMKLNPEKCVFGVPAGKFLGFMVSQRGIEANPEKIRAVLEMEPPKTVKEVQRLTGKLAALNRFLARSADKCRPFFLALKKINNFEWTEDCQKSFEDLKAYLTKPPLLARPVAGDVLQLYIAVSDRAVSAVLIKEIEKVQHPIYYVSKTMAEPETRYPLSEKTALALVVAARKLRPYFQAHTIEVLTNFPIKAFLSKFDAAGRLVKWAVELSEFDVKYKPRPSIKAQALADFIVECTYEKEGVKLQQDVTWKMNFDGSSTKEGSGAGVVLIGPSGEKFEYALSLEFSTTNNEAEYEALILGLELAIQMEVTHLQAYSDSQLVVQQMNGQYEAREVGMQRYLAKAKELIGSLSRFEILHVPRSQNLEADSLSKLASVNANVRGKKIHFEVRNQSSVQDNLNIHQFITEGTWMNPIKKYLLTGEEPEDPVERKKLRRRAVRFALINGILFKKAFSMPYLRCLVPEEADYALREAHEGVCGNHIGYRSLAHLLVRSGYYWPTMKEDAKELVMRCDKCQRFAGVTHVPSAELKSMQSTCPFSKWGIDILGPFPIASGQRKFLIVAVDYFTKWVEAEPVPTITESKTTDFLWKSIVCRFGIPRVIITDNGKQFDGKKFKGRCQELGIDLRFTSVAHPQSNGQAEVTNRTILQSLKKRLDAKKGSWADELPELLWSYRTTPRTSTGETPFMLAFGSEAVIPVEIGIPSPRIQAFTEDENNKQRRADLDLIAEVRDNAALRNAAYKQRVARFYNRRVRGRQFQVGDLVLRKAAAAGHPPGKLGPTWEGPWRVSKRLPSGAYRLRDEEGRELANTWNADNLKKYYA